MNGEENKLDKDYAFNTFKKLAEDFLMYGASVSKEKDGKIIRVKPFSKKWNEMVKLKKENGNKN